MNYTSSVSIIFTNSKHNLMINQSIVHGFIILFFAAAVPFAAGQTATSPSRPGLNTEFNPTMAILIVALISAFFFLGFFLIYVRQCAGDGRNGGSVRPTNGAGGRSRRGKRGLDPDVIETFPIVNYSDVKGLKIGKGALECAVCLNEFEDDETLRLLPKCDHVFHPECIDAWLVAHVTCPVCRANLKPESSIDVVVTDDVATAEAREVSDSDDDSGERNNEMSEVRFFVTTDQNPQAEVINSNQTPIQNRPVILESTRIDGKFSRSHSTGHSLIQPGENCERFTLRLPDDVRKRIVNGRLNRTTSCLEFPTGDGSVSGGRGEGSSRGRSIRLGRVDRNVKSDRWIFSKAPPFFTRTSSVKSQKVTDGDGSFGGSTSSAFPRGLRNSVRSPLTLDCLGAKGEGGTDVSNGRPPV